MATAPWVLRWIAAVGAPGQLQTGHCASADSSIRSAFFLSWFLFHCHTIPRRVENLQGMKPTGKCISLLQGFSRTGGIPNTGAPDNGEWLAQHSLQHPGVKATSWSVALSTQQNPHCSYHGMYFCPKCFPYVQSEFFVWQMG